MRTLFAIVLGLFFFTACNKTPKQNTTDCFESKLNEAGSSIKSYMATVQRTGAYMKKGDQEGFQVSRDTVKQILLAAGFLSDKDFEIKELMQCLEGSDQMQDEASGVFKMHAFFKKLTEKEDWDKGEPLAYIGELSMLAKDVSDENKEFETAFYVAYFCIDIHLERVYTQKF
ncbi:MAG: hypothetical protein JXQ87_02615 [Bacteroidia bacterium]